MIRKIFICGAHSVGKSTLFECLKKYLRIENVKLLYYQEVARNLAEENNLTAVSNDSKLLVNNCVTSLPIITQ